MPTFVRRHPMSRLLAIKMNNKRILAEEIPFFKTMKA